MADGRREQLGEQRARAAIGGDGPGERQSMRTKAFRHELHREVERVLMESGPDLENRWEAGVDESAVPRLQRSVGAALMHDRRTGHLPDEEEMIAAVVLVVPVDVDDMHRGLRNLAETLPYVTGSASFKRYGGRA